MVQWLNANDRVIISNSWNVRTLSQIRLNFKTKQKNVRVGIRCVCLYSILTTVMVSSECVYSSPQQTVCRILVFTQYVSFLNPIDRCPLCRFPLYGIKQRSYHWIHCSASGANYLFEILNLKVILFWLYILLSKTNIGSVISGRLIDLSTTMSDFSETEVRFTNKEGRFFIFAYFSSLL